jgi:hypothetical protein
MAMVRAVQPAVVPLKGQRQHANRCCTFQHAVLCRQPGEGVPGLLMCMRLDLGALRGLNAECLAPCTAGGAEVAKFCQEHIAAELMQLEQYQQGKVGESLVRVRHQVL